MDIFEQYQVTVYRTVKARGGYICDTNQGVRLVREYNGKEEGLLKQAFLTDELEKRGFYTDTFVRTKEGKIVAQDEDYRTYYMKSWFDGRECDASNMRELVEAAKLLGKLHNVLSEISFEPDQVHQAKTWEDLFSRRTKELNSVKNYLRAKKKKNSFEEMVQENIDYFLQKAQMARELLLQCQQLPEKRMCHGSYNHHNIIMTEEGLVVTNFSKASIGYQVTDLYDFLRKMLEKYEWDMKIGMRLFEGYCQERELSAYERQFLGVLFCFPEKYWKIVNHYYNSNKAWFPDKDMEKLKKVQAQEKMHKFFAEKFAYNLGLW